MTRTVEPIEFSVYDGRAAVGFVRPRGGQFEAVTAEGQSLGLFNQSQAAANALMADWHRAKIEGAHHDA